MARYGVNEVHLIPVFEVLRVDLAEQRAHVLGDRHGAHQRAERREIAAEWVERIQRVCGIAVRVLAVEQWPTGAGFSIDAELPPGGATWTKIAAESARLSADARLPHGCTATASRVRTARGGHHLYFTAPPGVRLRNSVNRLGAHIDTRAWGGYVVAPGSVTPDGTYEVADDLPVASLPAWLADQLATAAVPTHIAPTPVRDGTRAAQVALERECDVIAAATEGGPEGRNNTLHRSACKVARFVAWGNLPRQTAEEAIQAAGEATGLSPAECRTTIRSAFDWVITHASPRTAA